VNSSIKELYIDFGRRGIVGVGLEILKAYHNDKNLTHLSIRTRLKNGSEHALASTLRGCTSLTTVKLSNNNITDEQLLPIIEAIKRRPSLLERLELCDNRIGDDGSQALATLLEDQNCNLQYLDLTGNNITNEGVRLVANSLVSNTKLKALYLKKNPVSDVLSLFSNVLCNRSSINSTYKSNHSLVDLEIQGLVRTGGYLHSLLRMNEGTDKSRVSSDKILKYHPNMALPSSVFEWDEEGKRTLKSLPHVVDWFDEAISASPLNRAQTNIEAQKLSVIFQFALAMPTLFVPVPHNRRVENNDPTLTTLTIGWRDDSSDAYTRFASSVGNDYDRLGTAIGKNSHLSDLHVSVAAPINGLITLIRLESSITRSIMLPNSAEHEFIG